MNYAIILSGGIGSRFWPLSRESKPKQFLNITSDEPLILETVQRVKSLIKKENIYLAANIRHVKRIRESLEGSGIPLRNVLFEPEGKNTFAPIAVLSKVIYELDKNAVIAVFPSDHFVADKKEFIRVFKQGVDTAKQKNIVTFGIKPLTPQTGYGYIRIASRRKAQSAKSCYAVDKFIEKPDLATAKKLIRDKHCYWNSGIFIFRADSLLEELRRYASDMYKKIIKIHGIKDCKALWHKFANISIDYAIMQKTKKIVLLPLDCGWTDLGSWQAVYGVLKKDNFSNVLRGKCISVGTKNSFIWSASRVVAALGLENIIIVDTQDALLVCRKDKAQDVKKIVEILKLRKLNK